MRSPQDVSLQEVKGERSVGILQGRVPQEEGGVSSVKRTLTLKQATLFPLTFSLELFPAPVLKASLSLPILEGQLVNLSCETKLLLQRPGVQLYFSFYVGDTALMHRNASSGFQILSARTEDSGLYWCEAATGDGAVVRRSSEVELQVLGECVCGGVVRPRGRCYLFPSGAEGWLRGLRGLVRKNP